RPSPRKCGQCCRCSVEFPAPQAQHVYCFYMSSSEADLQYQTAVDLKTKGQIDAALTAFRRAVLADPKHFASQMGIGYICREKAKSNTMFQRYAFEAFRAAA